MAREAQAVLLVPGEAGHFELRLVFPKGHIKNVGGPVEVTVLFGDTLFARETRAESGAFRLRRPIPEGLLLGRSVKVTIRLDRALPPTGADRRELGAIVESLGLK